MSQDANQGYGDNTPPSQLPPYGQPPQGQNPYGQPPTGYGTTPQNPYGVPQNPYEASQNPYSAPQNPYGGPPGYNVPPPGSEPAFSGLAGNQFRLRPLPLNEALKQLPDQYKRVLTRPGAATFAEELPKASWDITLIQLLFMIVIGIVVGLITALLSSLVVHSLSGTGLPGSSLQSLAILWVSTSIGSAFLRIITVPLSFFIGVGIQFLLAKAFGGQGTFLTQSYTALLYQVPIAIVVNIASLLGVIPLAGEIIIFLIGLATIIYSIVLNVFQLMAVHRLSGGKAVWVVLIPYIALFVVGLLCVLTSLALIFSIMRNVH